MKEVNHHEFRLDTPEIFQGLAVRYGETRRDPTSPRYMSGNSTESEAIIGHAYNTYSLDANDDIQAWTAERLAEARIRVEHMRRLLGFQAGLALARPVHETGLIDADTSFDTIRNELPLNSRAPGDAIVTRTPERGSMYNPADCILANVAYYNVNAIATAQIHAGWKGLRDDIIGKTLYELNKTGLTPSKAIVYISPHARSFTLYGSSLESLRDAGLRDYLDMTRSPIEPIFNMTRLAQDQLENAGVKFIDVSEDDSMTDPTLYSHYLHRHDPQAPVGRNGVAFGLRSPR